jgi:hypothetical protein
MNSCSGPVKVVPLAYDAPALISDPLADKHTDNGNKPLQILTIGHVNPNKRVSSVINAIGSSRILRNNVVYRLVGAVQQETINALTDLAKKLDVQLTISGEVDDSELQDAIQASDIISCLRWPALEAASASAIESMLYGKAIMVTDTGFYKEIPEECSVKINHENEINEIQFVLLKFIKKRSSIKDIGDKARLWASERFTAINYTSRLINALQIMAQTIPKKRAINFFYDTLGGWTQVKNMFINKELLNTLNIFEAKDSNDMMRSLCASLINNKVYKKEDKLLHMQDSINDKIANLIRNQENINRRIQRLELKFAKGPLHLRQLLRHPKAFAREVLGLKFIK